MLGSIRLARTLLAGALFASAGHTSAAVVDPANDFLPTYTGATFGDIDILGAHIGFDGGSFLLSATMAADIVSRPGQLYAWGINRGAGAPRIDLLRDPDIAPGILFDAVVVMLPNGALSVVNIPTVGAPSSTFIPAGTTVSGGALSATVPLTLLPSTGFSPENYTFGLWSRIRLDPGVDGSNNEIADFLQGSGSLVPSLVPEPGTWLMMLLGIGMIGGVMRRWRRLAIAG